MLLLVFIFQFGLVVGSFLNVIIVRLPGRQSVVFPSSRCPRCSAPIAAYDNIPVVSFLVLRGRCRQCRQPIPLHYPTVELLTGVVLAGAFWKFGLSPGWALNSLFFSGLIALIFIDLHHRILPDALTLPIALAGVCLSYFQDSSILKPSPLTAWLDVGMPWGRLAAPMAESLLGAFLGAGILWLVGFIYYRLRKIEGLGAGDIKLMLAIGAFLGWTLAWLTIFLGSFLGAVVGSCYMLHKRKDFRYELPFGSFLGVAAIASTFWGRTLIDWYGSLYG